MEKNIDPEDIKGDIARLMALGEALYGKAWKSPLAKAIGISPSHLSDIISGSNGSRMTPAVKRKLADFVIEEMPRWSARTRRSFKVLSEAQFWFDDEMWGED